MKDLKENKFDLKFQNCNFVLNYFRMLKFGMVSSLSDEFKETGFCLVKNSDPFFEAYSHPTYVFLVPPQRMFFLSPSAPFASFLPQVMLMCHFGLFPSRFVASLTQTNPSLLLVSHFNRVPTLVFQILVYLIWDT